MAPRQIRLFSLAGGNTAIRVPLKPNVELPDFFAQIFTAKKNWKQADKTPALFNLADDGTLIEVIDLDSEEPAENSVYWLLFDEDGDVYPPLLRQQIQERKQLSALSSSMSQLSVSQSPASRSPAIQPSSGPQPAPPFQDINSPPRPQLTQSPASFRVDSSFSPLVPPISGSSSASDSSNSASPLPRETPPAIGSPMSNEGISSPSTTPQPVQDPTDSMDYSSSPEELHDDSSLTRTLERNPATFSRAADSPNVESRVEFRNDAKIQPSSQAPTVLPQRESLADRATDKSSKQDFSDQNQSLYPNLPNSNNFQTLQAPQPQLKYVPSQAANSTLFIFVSPFKDTSNFEFFIRCSLDWQQIVPLQRSISHSNVFFVQFPHSYFQNHDHVEFKFIVTKDRSNYEWETGPDRTITGRSPPKHYICFNAQFKFPVGFFRALFQSGNQPPELSNQERALICFKFLVDISLFKDDQSINEPVATWPISQIYYAIRLCTPTLEKAHLNSMTQLILTSIKSMPDQLNVQRARIAACVVLLQSEALKDRKLTVTDLDYFSQDFPPVLIYLFDCLFCGLLSVSNELDQQLHVALAEQLILLTNALFQRGDFSGCLNIPLLNFLIDSTSNFSSHVITLRQDQRINLRGKINIVVDHGLDLLFSRQLFHRDLNIRNRFYPIEVAVLSLCQSPRDLLKYLSAIDTHSTPHQKEQFEVIRISIIDELLKYRDLERNLLEFTLSQLLNQKSPAVSMAVDLFTRQQVKIARVNDFLFILEKHPQLATFQPVATFIVDACSSFRLPLFADYVCRVAKGPALTVFHAPIQSKFISKLARASAEMVSPLDVVGATQCVVSCFSIGNQPIHQILHALAEYFTSITDENLVTDFMQPFIMRQTQLDSSIVTTVGARLKMAVRSFCKSQDQIETCFRIFNSLVPQGCDLSLVTELLNEAITELISMLDKCADDTTRIQSICATVNYITFLGLFNRFHTIPSAKTSSFQKVSSFFDRILSLLRQTMASLLNRTAIVAILHAVVPIEKEFVRILEAAQLMRASDFTSKFTPIKTAFQEMEISLSQMEGFMTQFASPFEDIEGVHTTATRISNLSKTWKTLQMDQAQQGLSSEHLYATPDLRQMVSTLFELRGCEPFLSIWKIHGPQAPTEATENADETTVTIPIQSVEDIKSHIFDPSIHEWVNILQQLPSKSIPLRQLDEHFSKIEINNVPGVAQTCVRSGAAIRLSLNLQAVESALLVYVRSQEMRSFFLDLNRALPILRLENLLKNNRQFTILKKFVEWVEAEWGEATVRDLDQHTAEVSRILIGIPVSDSLSFFKRFLQHPNLIQFLMELEDQHDKNVQQLFEVALANTDRDTEIHALEDLRASRLVVLSLIRAHKAPEEFSSLNDIFTVVKAFQLKNLNASIQSLDSAAASMTLVRNMLENLNRNAGARAIHELEMIIKHGGFEIRNPTFDSSKTWTAEKLSRGCLIARIQQNQTNDVTKTLDDLEELRNRVLLAADTGQKGVSEMIEHFLEQLILLREINLFFTKLFVDGHPRYQQYSEFYESTIEKAILEEEKNARHAEWEEWVAVVSEMRQRHNLLNYFSINTLLKLNQIGFPKTTRLSTEVVSLLQFIDRSLTGDEIAESLHSFAQQPQPHINVDAAFLDQIGSALNHIFRDRQPQLRHLANANQYDLGDPLGVDIHAGSPNLVVCTEPTAVLSTIITLYIQLLRRFPEPDEVLLCGPETTFEQLQLLLLRCFHPSLLGPPRMYLIANSECLDPELQQQVLRFLDSQLKNNPDFNQYRLVFMASETTNQHISNALGHKHGRTGIVTLPEDILQPILNNLFEMENIFVATVISQIPGAGKSFKCLQIAHQREQQLLTIPINGPIQADHLVKFLSRAEGPVAYHFNIAATANPSLNVLLFQLLILGVLHCSNGDIFHRPQHCCFLHEMPNSINDICHEKFFLLTLFTKIPVSDELCPLDFSDLNQTFTKDYEIQADPDPNEGIHIHTQHKIMYVCKFLHAFEKKQLLNQDIFPHQMEDLSPEQCKALLDKFAPSATTMLLRIHFVDYMFHVLRQYENNFFLRFISLNDGGEFVSLIPLRQAVIEWLLQTAIDFSISSMAEPQQQPQQPLQSRGSPSRLNAQIVAKSFELIRTWVNSDHPIILFKPDGSGAFIPLWRNPKRACTPQLLEMMEAQRFKFPALDNLTQEESYALLANMFDRSVDHIRSVAKKCPGRVPYVITRDNLFKIAAIWFRVEAGLPCIIIGETGCGKTRLIQFIADIQKSPLLQMNVHGGITEPDIIEFVNDAIQIYGETENQVFLFFDEINTSTAMGLFKEILCDHSMNGSTLPPHFVVIAACNPYRYRTSNSTPTQVSALEFKSSTVKSSIPLRNDHDLENLENLVYLVHPLPETMRYIVFDFGTVTNEDEKGYISNMIRHSGVIDIESNNLSQKLLDAIVFSHDHLRSVFGDPSAVSLRDMRRCISLISWFKKFLIERSQLDQEIEGTVDWSGKTKKRNKGKISSADALRDGMVLSLQLCYFFRLSEIEDRARYCTKICEIFGFREKTFTQILTREQEWWFHNLPAIPPCTSPNQALLENLYSMIVCIYNKIPIMIVGRPGMSKTLAMNIIKSNLSRENKPGGAFASLPAIEVFTHQCSPHSTSKGIEETFERAIRFQEGHKGVRAVVLLEEIGLAERSPHLPLKVLHRLLEEPELAVIGLSNWMLDPAKMNRSVFLSKPKPTLDELTTTAQAMIGNSDQLKSLVRSLSRAYNTIYEAKDPKPDFFGLRDFYHLIKFLNTKNNNPQRTISPKLIVNAVGRNFSGVSAKQYQKHVDLFLEKAGQSHSSNQLVPVLSLIKNNLNDPTSRHLLLITESDSALRILLDCRAITQANTTIFYGADFAQDNTDMHVARTIQRIRVCMETGQRIVLVNQDPLYESLYDMLNQNYTRVATRNYCTLAIGAHSRQCAVHDSFKCIVIVDKSIALGPSSKELPPPFLNRFEKQFLTFDELLTPQMKHDLEILMKFVKSACTVVNSSGQEHTRKACDVFVGVQDLSLRGLLVSSISMSSQEEMYADSAIHYDSKPVIETAKERLVNIMRPEHVMQLRMTKLKADSPALQRMYFRQQAHDNLSELIRQEIANQEASPTQPQHGVWLEVLTHSLRPYNLIDSLFSQPYLEALGLGHKNSICTLELSIIQNEYELLRVVRQFWESQSARILLVPCDQISCSEQHLLAFKFICTKERATLPLSLPKHVVIVRFLHRHIADSSRLALTFDVDWKQVYLDAIDTVPGVPQVSKMLGSSICSIIRGDRGHEGVRLEPIIIREYRSFLSRMEFLSSDIRALVDLMARLTRDAEFLRIFSLNVLGMIEKDENAKGTENPPAETETVEIGDWQLSVASRDQDLQKEGNLRFALYHKICATLQAKLSWLLGVIDRFGNLKLVEGSHHDLWLQILATNIYRAETASQAQSHQTGANRNEQQNASQFQIRFPFSYAIVPLVEQLRRDVDVAELKDRVGRLHQLIRSCQLSVVSDLSEEEVRDYIHDVAHMSSLLGPHAETTSAILNALLLRLSGDEAQIAHVHLALWKNEVTLRHIFDLLGMLPPNVSEQVRNIFISGQPEEVSQMGLEVARTILDSFDPSSIEMDVFSRRLMEARTALISLISTPLQSVASGDVDDADEDDLQQKGHHEQLWLRLQLFMLLHAFGELVVKPLHLEAVLYQSLWQLLCDTFQRQRDLSTVVAVDTLHEFLATQIPFPDDLAASKHAWKQVNKFFGHFLTDFALNPEFEVGGTLIVELILALCDKSPKFPNNANGEGISLSDPIRATILRRLFGLSGQNTVESWLQQNNRRELGSHMERAVQFDDDPLCVLYTDTFQDYFLQSSTQDLKIHPEIHHRPNNRSSRIERLEWTAHTRYLIDAFAAVLLRRAENRPQQSQAFGVIVESVETALCEGVDPTNPLSDARGMFLTKRLVKQGGLQMACSLLRDFAANRSQTKSPHAQYWLSLSACLRQLAGEDRPLIVPSLDPFLILEGDLYNELRKSIRTALFNKDLNSLQTAIQRAPQPPEFKRVFVLLMLKEIFSIYALPPDKRPPGFADTVALLSNQQTLRSCGFTDSVDANFVSVFIRNTLKLSLNVDLGATTLSQMLLVGVLAHFCSILLSLPSSEFARSVLGPLRQLMINPASQANTFLPSMPEDPRKQNAAKILVNPDHGAYLSPNGHLYVVPPCGFPMSVEKCGICGENIGGNSHKPLDGHYRIHFDNAPAGEIARYKQYCPLLMPLSLLNSATPRGYAIELKLSDEDAAHSYHNIPAVEFRVLRFLVNASLTLGCIIENQNRQTPHVVISNSCKDVTAQMRQDPAFFLKRLKCDWALLHGSLLRCNEEDLALMLQLVIDKFVHPPASATNLPADFSNLNTFQQRDAWEQFVATQIVRPVLVGMDTELQRLKTALQQQIAGEQQYLQRLQEELSETIPSSLSTSAEYRQRMAPALMRNRVCVDLSFAKNVFLRSAELCAQFPLLNLIFKDEAELGCLKFLPDVIQWQRLLYFQLDRRLSRAEASNKTIESVLESVKTEQDAEIYERWLRSFAAFEKAWNLTRPFVKQYREADINLPEMSIKLPVIHCLNAVNGGAETLQPLALINFLINKQTSVINQVKSSREGSRQLNQTRLANQRPDLNSDNNEYLDLYLASRAHMVDLSLDSDAHSPGSFTEALRVATTTSLRYGEGNQLQVDYSQLEAFVADRLVAGKPFISSRNIRMFSFSNEVHLGDIPRLIRSKVEPQVELSDNDKTSIWQELAIDQTRQQCLRTLDICMNFLKTAGGNSNQALADYAQSVLALEPDDLHQCGFSLPAFAQVQLRHVLSLWSLLFTKLNPNPLDMVMPCYRAILDKKQRETLTAFVKNLSINALKLLQTTVFDFCKEYLTEDTYQPNQALADFVGQLVLDNAELASAPLPPTLQLAHSVDFHAWLNKRINAQPR